RRATWMRCSSASSPHARPVATIAGPLVTLLINPLEPDHQRLYEAIDAALKRLKSNDAADAETEADIETITALAQAILKREWQRAKMRAPEALDRTALPRYNRHRRRGDGLARPCNACSCCCGSLQRPPWRRTARM